MRTAFFAVSLWVASAWCQAPLSIEAAKLRVVLKNGSSVVVLPITNSSPAPIGGMLEVAWLAPDDTVAGQLRQPVTLAPGIAALEIPLPINGPSLWTRLRYSLTPTAAEARAFARVSGVRALPHLADHVFELKVSQAGVARRGQPITVHAQAMHPLTGLPVADVRWTASFQVGDKELPPRATQLLNAGVAEFVFDLPKADADDHDLNIAIHAQRGDYTQEASLTLRLTERKSARLQTDKPIYQPGQTLNMRAIVLDAEGRADAGALVTLRIDDDGGERVHTAKLTASKFGVVSDNWPLPATASLGQYRLTLSQEDQIAQHTVRVSRYQLPNFRVTAQPLRTAFLPTEPVRVKIEGRYLFGKPVPNGRVTLMRQGSEEAEVEGHADKDGIFTTVLDVAKQHARLKQDGFARFEDLSYSATYQDPSSGRIERRRFQVRLSLQPIHVYVSTGNSGYVYLITSYADGRSVSAAVEIRANGRLTTLLTNRYGVAKARVQLYSEMDIQATDSAGLVGRHHEPAGARASADDLQWDSVRTLYRVGESVTLRLTKPANGPAERFVIVHAMADGRRISSRVAHLVNHTGEVTFPYQADFRRTIVFAASGENTAKAVIFPDGADLVLRVSTDRPSYRPGDKSALRLTVSALDAKPVPAAIGLAVVDAAVLERATTDSDFGQRPWFACAFCPDTGESEIGGIRLRDLYHLKPGTPLTPELDLVAEALVSQETAAIELDTDESLSDPPSFPSLAKLEKTLKERLDRHYLETIEFPQKIDDFLRLAASLALTDPWDQPLAIAFGIDGANRFITMGSDGPDQQRGTADDFLVATFQHSYFAPLRRLIAEALDAQTDYPATETEFAQLLRSRSLLLESLVDPWGTSYRAKVNSFSTTRHIDLSSAGPDRRFGTLDDVSLANFRGAYFVRETAAISAALQAAIPQPRTEAEFTAILQRAGLHPAQLRDAWNQPFEVRSLVSSTYGDRVISTTEQVFGGPPQPRIQRVPVTQKFIIFTLRSKGRDGVDGTYDDFAAAAFPVLLTEESATPVSPAPPATPPRPSIPGTGSRTGAIAGIVTDSAGSVIPGVAMILVDINQANYTVSSGAGGVFYFAAVPAGLYTLRAEAPGFAKYTLSQVPVFNGQTTHVNFQLQVGSLAQAVEVSARADTVQTESTAVSASPAGTPRVRDYFPETLLWLPELLTDANGVARADLKLADSVTTWKVAAVASTVDGRIVEAESDLRAFQPFFLEFAPPPILTDGDQLTLPVTVRNYQTRPETVAVSLPPAEGLAIVGAASAKILVPANASANVSFTVQAKGARDQAKARIIAKASRAQDAIEKSLRVHPDGQQVSQTFADMVAGRVSFPVTIPPSALPGSTRAELRLYPNLASLLLESAAAILVTPHGCAEQTISAAYANLVAWRFARSAGVVSVTVEKRALSNVKLGIESLASFRSADQGIAYWPHSDADLAVTAHALSFLVEASTVVPVEPDHIASLISWLEDHPAKDDQSALLVARSLAAAKQAGHDVSSGALGAAYHRLATIADLTQEPYLLANFILAALDSGDDKLLGDAALRLAKQAHAERGGLYWDLLSNSPFHGWGTAGRYETTGLVVTALAAWQAKHPAPQLDAPIRQGLVFLLRGRDASHHWYSTQATLRAMQALTVAARSFGSGSVVEIKVNNRVVKSLTLAPDPQATDPILLHLAISPGDNLISLNPRNALALVSLTVTHWVPYAQPRTSPELRLAVTYSRQAVRVGELIRCHVKAERVGFRGLGMMLAEIGLPPGAEVDRASLEAAAIDHYEVQPDRLIVYLWPKAGGTSFDFNFTARFPMAAQSAPSALYDYNNPEARAELIPSRFVVR